MTTTERQRGEPYPIDEALTEVTATCHCPKCGQDRVGPVQAALVTWLGQADGKVSVWCPECIAEDDKRNRTPRISHATGSPSAFDEAWAILCPDEYRLTSEGGFTDRERLKKAHGDLVGENGSKTRVGAKAIAELIHTRQMVILGGDPGTMKTRIAWRMVRMVWDTKASVRCFSSWQFQAQSQDSAGSYEHSKWMADLMLAELVFLDDLGKAQWTANTHGAFFELLDARITRRKPTLITTNETFESLTRARANHKSEVAQSTAGGIIRRMRQYAQRVAMLKPE